MEKDSIKSPFVQTKLIEKQLNGEKIVQDSLYHFALLIRTAKEENRTLDATVFHGYVAGFTSTLIIIGFEPKDAAKLGERLMVALLNVGK